MTKKKFFFIILTLLFFSTIIALFYLIKRANKRDDSILKAENNSILCLSDSTHWADSLYSKLTTEEKATFLLIAKVSNSNRKNLDFKPSAFCGFFITYNAENEALKAIKEHSKNTALCPFVLAEDEVSLQPKNKKFLPDIPWYMFYSDSVKQSWFKTLCLADRINSVNCSRIPLHDKMDSVFTNNDNIKTLYSNVLNFLLLMNKDSMPCWLDLRKYNIHKKDSAFISLFIKNNLISGIIADKVEKYPQNYKGLKFLVLSENTDFEEEQLKKILLSEADAYIIENNVEKLKKRFENLIKSGEINDSIVKKKITRILKARRFLTKVNKIKENDYKKNPFAEASLKSFIEHSVILLKNKRGLFPLKNPINSEEFEVFCPTETQKILNDVFSYYDDKMIAKILKKNTSKEDSKKQKIKNKRKYIFISVRSAKEAKQYFEIISTYEKEEPALVLQCPVEVLPYFERFENLLYCPSLSPEATKTLAYAMLGAVPTENRLPFDVSADFCQGDGIVLKSAIRVMPVKPEEIGINPESLNRIDSLVSKCIDNQVFPGCQILACRDGKIFYRKTFGYTTYEQQTKENKIKPQHLYDLASVTKILATTLCFMKLYEQGKVHPDSLLSKYLDDLDNNSNGKRVRNSELKNISLRELLTHKSGLPEGLPIYQFIDPEWALKKMIEPDTSSVGDTLGNAEETLFLQFDTLVLSKKADSLRKYYFSEKYIEDIYETPVAENLYFRTALLDSLWDKVKRIKPRQKKEYLYSDLNMYLIQKVIEKVSKTTLDEYFTKNIAQPLGLKNTMFCPLNSRKKEEIVPTEDDRFFRKQLIQGYVHDPLAALHGGVCGNAGLFSNMDDLCVLMQMLLNKGSYGGIKLFLPKTVETFVSKQPGSSRGLGFHLQTNPPLKLLAKDASIRTFGHTGFTGTCVWADPQNKLIYIFLSNRVHPKSSNQKLNQQGIRQRIHQFFYEAMKEK